MDPNALVRRLAARIRTGARQPVAHLIVEDLWLAVVEGTLAAGERLPTARQLAVELGVSPGTVERAYEDLERLGVAATRLGEGTFVALNPPAEEERARRQGLASLCRDALERAEALGFGVDDVLETLAGFRTLAPGPPQMDRPV
jgi:GntR family transcriptional regulator